MIFKALERRLETHENFIGLTEEDRSKICDFTERFCVIISFYRHVESSKRGGRE
jgi:hypothetical protein